LSHDADRPGCQMAGRLCAAQCRAVVEKASGKFDGTESSHPGAMEPLDHAGAGPDAAGARDQGRGLMHDGDRDTSALSAMWLAKQPATDGV